MLIERRGTIQVRRREAMGRLAEEKMGRGKLRNFLVKRGGKNLPGKKEISAFRDRGEVISRTDKRGGTTGMRNEKVWGLFGQGGRGKGENGLSAFFLKKHAT